jgi:hypothetical protein
MFQGKVDEPMFSLLCTISVEPIFMELGRVAQIYARTFDMQFHQDHFRL